MPSLATAASGKQVRLGPGVTRSQGNYWSHTPSASRARFARACCFSLTEPIAFQELELELEVVPGVGLAVGAWSPRCPLASLWPPPHASFEPSSSQT
jgi:hypothetical protein